MSNYKPPTADQINFRVQSFFPKGSTNPKGAILLAYKDARYDIKMLDELYGKFGWKKSYELIDNNLYCTVSVKNPDTGEWVSKQDVGTESMTEKEKGQASDAFKRACFNWGLGIELYDFPFIVIKSDNVNETQYDMNNRIKSLDWKVEYDDKNKVSYLGAVDRRRGKIVFEFGKPKK